MIRKNLYKWHRTSSLIIAIPVLLWALSGFLHPIMTTIRPKVATQWLIPSGIDSNKIKVPLQMALQQNAVDSFHSFRLVCIDTSWFYQVNTLSNNELQYYSVTTGKILKKGDWLYAQYLARQFLEGQKNNAIEKKYAALVENADNSDADCCNAAVRCVLKPNSGAKVKEVEYITSFNSEYKSINRVLPVYKVGFIREDGIRIYVETSQDRFSLAVDNKRAWFSTFFGLVHTMEWLALLGKGRLFMEMGFTALAFLTAILGIYIFLISKSKRVKSNEVVKARRNHRYTAIVFSLFTLMFAFSGCYHAFSKLTDDTRDQYFVHNHYSSRSISFNFQKLQFITKKTIYNISLVNIGTATYWQVYVKDAYKKTGKEARSKDLMKEMSAAAPVVFYINTTDYSILKQGEKVYASYLATVFSKNKTSAIVSSAIITKFEGEYGFVNKRLPVWKISYASNNHERFYVETSSGKLGVRVDDKDLWEANSFNFLHKHHFMDFAGKGCRDFSTMFGAASQIALVLIGLILYFKQKGKSKKA